MIQLRTLSEWLAYIEAQHAKPIDMGLDRIRDVSKRMGLSTPAKHVITVAGTNGKGSTVAFIEAIARAAGWRVGAYTSPHILHYNERVRVDGADASDQALMDAFEVVERARGGTSLTYFEYGTLAALWLFERDDLDLAVLEVGLGGRLDAINIVDADVAVVTTVDLDHQNYLGDTREAIGREKVGIARAWKPLVLGEDDPPSSVLEHAYAIGASTIRAGCDFFFDIATAESAQSVESWRWREIGYELSLPMPQLHGSVQLRNASTAIAAMRALSVDLPESFYAAGISAASIPARLQHFDVDGVAVIVDIGHNPQAARTIADWLQASAMPKQTTYAIFAALGDKDVASVAAILESAVDRWHLAGTLGAGSRGIAVDAFAGRLAATTAGAGQRHYEIASALHAALEQAVNGDRIAVFGSFHAAAEAIEFLNARS